MSLKSLLRTGEKKKKRTKGEVDTEKIKENLEFYQDLIDYWRKYPDKFIDYLCSLNPHNTFKFFFVQRLYLRIAMRYRTVYAVFSRGFSKSFLAVLCLMVKAILYPNAVLSTVADGKGQSAAILSSKITELCRLIPALALEIEWDTRGKISQTSQTKDSVRYSFKNGSILQNWAISENTRGARAQSILTEEVAKVDQDKYEEIIVPTLVISRKINGEADPHEVLNQSAIYVTSAGYKNSYAYRKLIETLCHMIADKPNEAFILGGDWRIPVIEGLQPANFIQAQELGDSMDEAGFDREFNSLWAGSLEGAFFDINKFDKHRILNIAETSFNKGINAKGYYVMGVDVGRIGCCSEVVIIKVTPSQTGGLDRKQIVNIFTYEEEHFGVQAVKIKRLFHRYKCDMCVVDANGLGIGLVDYLITDQIDPDTDEMLYNFGIVNYDDMNEKTKAKYKSFETEDTIHNALYLMKANSAINSDMYSYCQTQLQSGKLQFLIDTNLAKSKLMTQSQGQKMTTVQRADYLRPYVATDILKSQMANLIQDGVGANVALKQANSRIPKDKVSALCYGLYWCKLKEDKRKKRKNRNIADFMFFSKRPE